MLTYEPQTFQKMAALKLKQRKYGWTVNRQLEIVDLQIQLGEFEQAELDCREIFLEVQAGSVAHKEADHLMMVIGNEKNSMKDYESYMGPVE